MNIFGKYFDDNEKALKSLVKIYGLGRTSATELGLTFGIGHHNKVKDLSKDMWSRIIQAMELGPTKYHALLKFNKGTYNYAKDVVFNVAQSSGQPKVERQQNQSKNCFSTNKKLRQLFCETRAIATIRDNIDLAKKIKSYKGLRHIEGLPCRGQRTHTNALTVRKKRAHS